MRPPLSATPPISHMVPQNLSRRPSRDWSTLTSDSSIQILQLSSADHTFDEHMLLLGQHHDDITHVCDDVANYNDVNNHVTNTLDLVEKIRVTSPHQTQALTSNSNPGPDPCDVQILQTETLVALDSIKHSSGCTLDAKLLFARGKDVFVSESDLASENRFNAIQETGKTLTRNMYSDSDMMFGRSLEHSNIIKITKVNRSKSLGYHEHTKRRQERGLLCPLKPTQANRSKVGNVKRLPCVAESFHNGAKSKLSKSDEKKTGVDRKLPIRHTESLRLPSAIDVPKSKLAKFMKTGLKTIIRSKDSFSIHSDGEIKDSKLSTVQSFKERRNRRSRIGSDLGGLSEFLRRNERRKTMALFPELSNLRTGNTSKNPDMIVEEDISENDNESGTRKQNLNKRYGQGRSDLKYTPKPWTGTMALATSKTNSKGTSHLQFASCQRKLVFPNKVSGKSDQSPREGVYTAPTSMKSIAGEHHENKDSHCYEVTKLDKCAQKEMFECFKITKESNANSKRETGHLEAQLDDQEQASKRPRLGVLGLSKPVPVIPIDDLEMDIVRDLKRRISKANRVSKIKTNGSLKTRPRIGQIHKPVFSPKKPPVLTRSSRMMQTNALLKQNNTKRESFV